MKPIRVRTGISEAKWLVRLLAFLSLLAVIAAAMEVFNPSTPPFSGRKRWFLELIFQLAGTYGLVALWLCLAAGLALLARFMWRHASKLPHDRWFW